jgi:hypothetical protein
MMAQTYSLDSVIKKVESRAMANGDSQKIVVIDINKKTAVNKKSIFGVYNNYLVSTSIEAKGSISGIIISAPDDFDKNVVVSGVYKVSCKPGNESKAVISLFDSATSPSDALEKLINKWVREECREREDFSRLVRECVSKNKSLPDRLKNRAFEETGLTLNIKLSLNNTPSAIAITKDTHKLRTLDNNEDHLFRVYVELEVDEVNVVSAVLNSKCTDQLHEHVLTEIGKYVKANVNTHDFIDKSKKTSIKNKIEEHLNLHLKKFGRKVGVFKIELDDSGIKYEYRDEIDVSCTVQQYPDPVVIKNTVQMLLMDVGKYKAEKSPKLGPWLIEKLDSIIKRELFDATYTDLVINFKQREEIIKSYLTKAADEIGYEIKHFLSGPDLDRLKHYSLNLTEGFETSLSRFFVKLNIIINVRIDNPKSIEKYINHRQNVQDVMARGVLEITRLHLHKITPKRFYMHFTYPDPATGAENSVENELTELIAKEMKDEYGADDVDIILKVVETDIIRKYNELVNKHEIFTTTIPTYIEPITIGGRFRVEDIALNGWYKFQTRNFDINDIREYIEQTLRTYPQLAVLLLNINTIKDQIEMEKLVHSIIAPKLENEYGITAKIENIVKESFTDKLHDYKITQHLDDNRELIKLHSISLKKELEKLLTKQIDLLTMPGSEQELEELENKINKVMTKLALKQIPKSSDKLSFDMTEILQIESTNMQNQQIKGGETERGDK